MSSSGLPPEAIEYQESHLYENYTRNIGGLYIVLVVLAFISMVLRIASRRLTKARLEADDWTFLAGAVCVHLCKAAWKSLTWLWQTTGEASFIVSLIYGALSIPHTNYQHRNWQGSKCLMLVLASIGKLKDTQGQSRTYFFQDRSYSRSTSALPQSEWPSTIRDPERLSTKELTITCE